MQTVIVEKDKGFRRIDRFLKDAFPDMPLGAMYKALRKKDIKVNGTRVKDDYVVQPGDVIEIYIIDSILFGAPGKAHEYGRSFTVAYEDKNLLIVNKKQGVPVHPDRGQPGDTLIDSVRAYLQEKGEFNPANPSSFPPSLCHRLDRNTGGLVMIAKSSEILHAVLEKLKSGEIRKFYQCLVKGRMDRDRDELTGYLIKDKKNSKVFISGTKQGSAAKIITRYRLLSYNKDLDISRLDIELITGRTHQIRAHMAYIGHPVIGDGKYGTNAVNRPLGARRQALWAYKVVFDFKKDAGPLNYLKGRKFEIKPEGWLFEQ